MEREVKFQVVTESAPTTTIVAAPEHRVQEQAEEEAVEVEGDQVLIIENTSGMTWRRTEASHVNVFPIELEAGTRRIGLDCAAPAIQTATYQVVGGRGESFQLVVEIDPDPALLHLATMWKNVRGDSDTYRLAPQQRVAMATCRQVTLAARA